MNDIHMKFLLERRVGELVSYFAADFQYIYLHRSISLLVL